MHTPLVSLFILLITIVTTITTQIVPLEKLAVKIYSAHLTTVSQDLHDGKLNPDIQEVIKKELINNHTDIFPLPALMTLQGHTDRVKSIAWSPNEQYALTGSDDKTARLWDLNTGKTIHELQDHIYSVTSVALSTDGKYALTGSDDETVRLWDLNTGQTIQILQNHTDSVNAVAFSPDSQHALTGSDDMTARLWNLADLTEEPRILHHTSYVTAVTFSQNSIHAVTGCQDGTVYIWDLTHLAASPRILQGHHSKQIISLAISKNDKYIATYSRDAVCLWDITTGESTGPLHGNTISAAFSSDDQYALIGSAAHKVYLCDLVNSQVTTATLESHTNRPLGLMTISPSGKYVLTAPYFFYYTTPQIVSLLGLDDNLNNNKNNIYLSDLHYWTKFKQDHNGQLIPTVSLEEVITTIHDSQQ